MSNAEPNEKILDDERSLDKGLSASHEKTSHERHARVVDEEFGGTEARKKLEVSSLFVITPHYPSPGDTCSEQKYSCRSGYCLRSISGCLSLSLSTCTLFPLSSLTSVQEI